MLPEIIHIGFPKTGTTSLQRNFFSKHPEIIYRGQTYQSHELRRLVEVDLLSKSEFEYDKDLVKKIFREEIAKVEEQETGNVFIFSHEAFTYHSDSYATDMAEIARRLHDISPEAKIIITIRRQDEMLKSLYKQAVKGGCYINFSSYLDYYKSVYHMSFLPLLKYIPIIKHYERLFGKRKVFVQCFEEMKENSLDYTARLSHFCGIQNLRMTLPYENVGFGKLGILLQRIANRILPYDLGRPQLHPSFRVSGEDQKIFFRVLYKTFTQILIQRFDAYVKFRGEMQIPRKWDPQISQLYMDSNLELSAEYGLPLKKYGYPGVK